MNHKTCRYQTLQPDHTSTHHGNGIMGRTSLSRTERIKIKHRFHKRPKHYFTTVWAINSATDGIPSILTPPDFLEINTPFTGGGKYLPELRRFHSLYRLLLRFWLNPWIDSWSTPAAPSFAFTFWYASQYNGFGYVKWLCHSEQFLLFSQLTFLFDRIMQSLRSSLITRPSSLLRVAPHLDGASVLSASLFTLVSFPLHHHRRRQQFNDRARIKITTSLRQSPSDH